MNRTEELFLELIENSMDAKQISNDFFERVNALNKNDKHAELKEQYAQDVETCEEIYDMEAWELWEFKFKDKESWGRMRNTPLFKDYVEYRRHTHADLMIQYHKCSDADKKKWQYKEIDTIDDWKFCTVEPSWSCINEYRLKPEMIAINGVEYNAPLREIPEMGAEYSFFNLETKEIFSSKWEDYNWENYKLSKNLLFATEFDCRAVLNAIIELLGGNNVQ